MTDGAAPAPSPLQVALTGCCPRCGARTLFAGWIRFAGACSRCGLDFTAFNVGDGAAAFLTLGIGALVAGLAIATELVFAPPVWVHILLWPIVTLALIFASLRASKAALLALEYRNGAREGRISDRA
ncbi:DUF983 domain-containing protein [Sphingomonas nostoxanthinifaciens]|nr:DUF983 domain-containing protein [Sphingomonas nostoxanthinifaciens]